MHNCVYLISAAIYILVRLQTDKLKLAIAVQILNILEQFPMTEFGWGSADAIHVLAEASRLAYADRSKHLGDPDFYDVPQEWLMSKAYAKELAATIDMQRARPSSEVSSGVPPAYESPDTTHFSVIDRDGNVVSNTTTLNFSFGSGIAVAGAGFLLNNEMDDFSAKAGVPNAYGLLGDEANEIQNGKRPLSSMTPTIVFNEGKAWFATGSPGGSRIITTVLQMIVNVIDPDFSHHFFHHLRDGIRDVGMNKWWWHGSLLVLF